MEDAWLLVKRDLYYMPDGMGYTGVRDRAGRYAEAEAKKHVYDPGENGNPVTMVRLTEAPEFSKACWDDVARSHLRDKRDEMQAALYRVVSLIDKAGLDNLTNGVQLGATSWFVKMSDAVTAAKALLPPDPNDN